MNSKIYALLILGAAFVVVVVPSVVSQSSPYAQQENSSAFDQESWDDVPLYMRDAEMEVVYSNVIQKRGEGTRCVDYLNKSYSANDSTYLECRETETYSYPKGSTYIFDIEDMNYRYLGGGKVHIMFDVVQNDLTNRIHRADNNQRQKEKFINWFNDNYLYRGGDLNATRFSGFVEYIESVDVEALGGSMQGKRLDNKNLMAASNSRIEAVVKMRAVRSGSVKLNDAVAVRLKTDAYLGGGETL